MGEMSVQLFNFKMSTGANECSTVQFLYDFNGKRKEIG